ncbi:hypothetical protein MRB53_024190 [Persea americana]|uniref:Uncharacterized protein n=1 Tax=Persea americana TaxID=3435 RepID=A0ACC2LBH8_PERAE|nr:hypothetical protein MRB53_024190 [Persea americana]
MTLLRLPSVRLQLFHRLILFLFFISQRTVVVDGQVPIPPRYDGFVYRKSQGTKSIVAEAFFDPLCPDSREAWPPLKQALTYYVSNRCSLSLIVHPFPLPSIVHLNGFWVCINLKNSTHHFIFFATASDFAVTRKWRKSLKS